MNIFLIQRITLGDSPFANDIRHNLGFETDKSKAEAYVSELNRVNDMLKENCAVHTSLPTDPEILDIFHKACETDIELSEEESEILKNYYDNADKTLKEILEKFNISEEEWIQAERYEVFEILPFQLDFAKNLTT